MMKKGDEIIFTKLDYKKENMIYGKTYEILDYEYFVHPKTGRMWKEFVMIIDETYSKQWFNLSYFDDEHELRKLKLNRITNDNI